MNAKALAHIAATTTDAEIEAFRREAMAAGDNAGAKRARQALRGNNAARRDVVAIMVDAAVADADALAF
jgi:hypothetical protein